MKTIIGNRDKLFFLIVAVFQMGCLAWVYRKYSEDFLFSLFMFVASTDYLSWMFNGVRQFIAACIFFACFGLIVRKKYVWAVLIMLVAATIHQSALITIPFIFIVQGKAWNKKTVIAMLVVIVLIVFVDRFTPLLEDALEETQYSGITTDEFWSQDDGTNIMRILFYSVPALMSLIGIKYILAAEDPVINVSVNLSILSAALYALSGVTSGIYIGRLPIYGSLAGYIAIPWMIDRIFSENSKKIVYTVFAAAFMIFFYYQMHITLKVL